MTIHSDDLKDARCSCGKLGELKKKIRSAYSERQRKATSEETKLDLKDFRLHASRIRADHLRFRIC